MAKRSPILGYNHNVRYRGIVFHVQTEDSGIINPHVFSHLFFGGIILSTRKLVYDPDATEDTVKSLMQAQHKAVLKDLRRGAFDDKIDVYLAGTPGLLPREAVADAGEAGAADAPASPSERELPSVEAPLASVEAPLPSVEAPPLPSVEASPLPPLEAIALDEREPPAPSADELEPDTAVNAQRVPAPPPPELITERDVEPLELEPLEPPAVSHRVASEPSAPAIEVIEALEPEPLDIDLPPLSFGQPAGSPPADLLFESTTARTPPPTGVVDETDRMPSLFETAHVPEPPPIDVAQAETLASHGRILPPPPTSPPPMMARTRTPTMPAPSTGGPPQTLPPPMGGRQPSEPSPSRTGGFSPVRVSFVSARGPTPPLEPTPPELTPVTPVAPVATADDLVPLDAIEDLLPPPLPVAPPLPTRGATATATPPFGTPRRAAETVPRLAGVPAPTPPMIPFPSTPPPMVAVPAPPPPPMVHGAAARAGGDTLQRLPVHPPAPPPLELDDDLLDANLVESADVAEIHAPPLPSATAPPGGAGERPSQYQFTRGRTDTPATSRPTLPRTSPVTSPPPARPAPGPTRPQVSGAGPGAFRPTPSSTPVLPRSHPRPATRPPANQPTARPEPVRTEPSAPAVTAPRAPTARPAPRPRPATGAGVVVSRPAVIVGAPTRATTVPPSANRPRRARDSAGEGLITERSLDEVILAYLSEDGSDE